MQDLVRGPISRRVNIRAVAYTECWLERLFGDSIVVLDASTRVPILMPTLSCPESTLERLDFES